MGAMGTTVRDKTGAVCARIAQKERWERRHKPAESDCTGSDPAPVAQAGLVDN